MAQKFRTEKSKKKQPLNLGIILIAIFVAAIMITSILGYMWNEDQTTQTYNGIKFKRTQSGWTASIKVLPDSKPSLLRFDFLPYEVESITIAPETLQQLKDTRMFYMTSDPRSNATDPASIQSVQAIALAEYELQQILWKEKKIYTQIGFTEQAEQGDGSTVGNNFPLITCANATSSVPVVEFRQGDITSVEKEGECIILQAGSAGDFIALKDRLLYGMFGVIP